MPPCQVHQGLDRTGRGPFDLDLKEQVQTAIVSGISGQDGAYLARLLLSKGYRVVGLIRPRRSLPLRGLSFLGIEERIELQEIDLLDVEAVEVLIKRYGPHEFYNLAAQSSVGASFKIPGETFSFNTLSVLSILEAIRKHSGGTRYYQASSSEMFGNIGEHNLPQRESLIFCPVSPYGISKASAHWLTINYREAYGLRACCGILFNHESCLRSENFVIKKILRTALEIRNGETDLLHLGNVSIQRDWGYAPKFVEAMWLMLQQEQMEDYLICSGTATSLEAFSRKVFLQMGLDFDKHVRTEQALMRKRELDVIYGDNSKARSDLGWDYSLTLDALVETLIADESEYQSWRGPVAQ